MTPAARSRAAIEVLDEIAVSPNPADQTVGRYLRRRRYIGSGDRRAISRLVFLVLRHRAKLGWWLDDRDPSARALVIAAHVLLEHLGIAELAARFDGSPYGPPPLAAAERERVERLVGSPIEHSEQPSEVRAEMPAWLYRRFAASRIAGRERELAALNREAPTDLRANLLKADREDLRSRLAEDGIAADPTPLSPFGLRLAGRRTLPALAAYKDGWFEVQDEGSQLVAQLVAAGPDMAVADLCAGAGGKTLALGAVMAGMGRLVALDVAGDRLAQAGPRLGRAGLEDVEQVPLAGQDDPWLADNAGLFDRVLVDAPCSGSGAWRRSPDARWRLTEARLDDHRAAQAQALEVAAGLVKPGGRLIYATCSLLAEENETQVEGFQARHPDFRPLPVPEVWAACLPGTCPSEAPTLQLTPARHGTDGFFVAIFERSEP